GSEHLRESIVAFRHAEATGRGIVPILERLVRGFQQRTGIETDLVVAGARFPLPNELAETLNAVARAALANVEHHAGASAAVRGLRIGRTGVSLSIQDDGLADPRPSPTRLADGPARFGLRGVGQHVRRLGGTFVARPARDGGFLVRVRLPIR